MKTSLQLFLTPDSVMAISLHQKIYVTDVERGLTFFGSVKSMNEKGGMISMSLLDVSVYEYSSSNYLYHEAEVSFLRPKAVLFIEEA